jgi:hypothetical protein
MCFRISSAMPPSMLKIGDLVCATCRRDGSRAIAAFSPTAISVQSPRREILDLLVTSPIVAEATAVALQNGPLLSSARFSEFGASHPWHMRSPDSVLTDLQCIPELAHVLSSLNPFRQRELLSGIGKAIALELDLFEKKDG